MRSAFAAVFAIGAAAMPAPQAGSTEPLRFGGTALRSASPIHFASVNAHDQTFYLGAQDTTTYCPTDSAAADACKTANTNQTIFSYLNSEGKFSLDTIVPGGQAVYVTEGALGEPAGQLKFTQAHSGQAAGPALYDGFSIVYDAKFQFEGNDWIACPVGIDTGSYTVHAASRLVSLAPESECLGFTWRVNQVGEETPSAWQYV